MSIYAIWRVALMGLILGVPPPLASAANEAPWDESPAPFLFIGDPLGVDQDRVVGRDIEIQSPAGLDVAEGHTLQLNGQVRSYGLVTAGLYKLGAGRMALSGPNTYRGNTMLLQGSLLLMHGEALGQDYNTLDANVETRLEYADGIAVAHDLRAEPVNLGALLPPNWWAPVAPGLTPGALQWAVEQGEASFLGTLYGTAPIVKLGEGTLRFAGEGLMYGGDMTVREGTLRVDSRLAGLTHIEVGARLTGTGTLGAARISGEVSPAGSGIGTLSVQGDLDYSPGAHTHIQIGSDGSGDHLQVGGVARLAGHVAVQALPGVWLPGAQATLLHAGAGLAGSRYDSVAGNLPYLSPELSYEPNRVLLTMRRNGTGLDTCGTTADARDAGQAIDQDVEALEDRLAGQNCPEAAHALASLAHVGAVSLRSAMIEDMRHIRQAALAHAGSGRAWTQSWFSTASRSAGMGQRGARWADSRDTSGLMLGVDSPIATGWYLGGFAGAQYMDFSTQGSPYGADSGGFRAHSASVHLGATLATGGEGWSIVLGTAYGQHRSRSRRDVGPQIGLGGERLSATQHARSTQAWVAWQMQQPLARGWTVQPWAQLAWVRLDSRAYEEAGGLAALRVRGAVDQRMLSTLGVQTSRVIPAPHGSARIHARLGWQAMMGATDLVSTQSFRVGRAGAAFEAGGQPLARHALQLELGVDAPIAPGVRLGMGYTGQMQKGDPQHGVVLNLGVVW